MSIVLDGTNGITAANVYGRNLIINGSGRINQRGYTSGTATSGANEYTLDRWRVVTSGQSLTFTGTDAGRVMTAPAGGAEQVIEGANIAGGTYVLNWTGTATATVDGNAVAKGGTFTLTANTNATVRFTSGTFSEVQVEAGSVATPFEHRSYGQELALCQRYYEVLEGNTGEMVSGVGQAFSSAIGETAIIYKVTKRAAPTVATTGTFDVWVGGGTASLSAVSFAEIRTSQLTWGYSGASAGTTGQAIQFYATSSPARVLISAEL